MELVLIVGIVVLLGLIELVFAEPLLELLIFSGLLLRFLQVCIRR